MIFKCFKHTCRTIFFQIRLLKSSSKWFLFKARITAMDPDKMTMLLITRWVNKGRLHNAWWQSWGNSVSSVCFIKMLHICSPPRKKMSAVRPWQGNDWLFCFQCEGHILPGDVKDITIQKEMLFLHDLREPCTLFRTVMVLYACFQGKRNCTKRRPRKVGKHEATPAPVLSRAKEGARWGAFLDSEPHYPSRNTHPSKHRNNNHHTDIFCASVLKIGNTFAWFHWKF